MLVRVNWMMGISAYARANLVGMGQPQPMDGNLRLRTG